MKIAVLIPVGKRHREKLQNTYPQASFIYAKASEITQEDVACAEIVIGNLPVSLIPHAKKLAWIQLSTAGADQYLQTTPRHIRLTNSTGAYGLAISEHMLGMLLMMMKKLHLYRDNQTQGVWRDEGGVTSIQGARALIVGSGDIGGEFGKRLYALGADVYGIRRTATKKDDWMTALYTLADLDDLLPAMDIVALCLPGTKETAQLMNRERLFKMKTGGFLLNVGRGSAIDTDALCDVLQAGHLGGAAVDVTDPEPLPANHPLWTVKNAIVTPHISGYYHLPETFERIVNIAAENLENYREGRELRNIVDLGTGYRTLVE